MAEKTFNESFSAEMSFMNLRLTKEQTMPHTHIGSSFSKIHICKALTKRVTVKDKYANFLKHNNPGTYL